MSKIFPLAENHFLFPEFSSLILVTLPGDSYKIFLDPMDFEGVLCDLATINNNNKYISEPKDNQTGLSL